MRAGLPGLLALPALLIGCGPDVSEPLFATVDRASVVPGEVRVDTSVDEDTGTGADGGDGGDDTGPFTGGCLELHGDPDYFAGGDSALPQGDAARTVEFWFKNTNVAGWDVVAGYGASGATFRVGFYNGFPAVEANGVAAYGSSNVMSDGSWHHLGATWDTTSGEIRIWIDGVLDAQQAASVATSSGGVFWLGDDPTSPYSGDAFTGVIDEVHLWNKALREGEFGGLFDAPPQGMVAWYTMNQEGAGAGLTLANEAGQSSLDLTSAGAPAFVPCDY